MQTTISEQTGSNLPKIVALFHIKTSFTFMVVQIIRIKSSNLIVMNQKNTPVLSLTLSVERVQVITIIYCSAFRLKVIDCVINQEVLYLRNGGSCSHTWNFLTLLMIRLPFHQVKKLAD